MTYLTKPHAPPIYKEYQSPLIERYASQEMSSLFSPQHKHQLWRQMWFYLASSEHELGLPVSNEQLKEIEKALHQPIDFDQAAEYESLFKHDVMAHLHTFADLCPKARPILHLGATSCLITDNAEFLIFQEALLLIEKRLKACIEALKSKAEEFAHLPCLAFTHFQVAQPTTMGKRFACWLQDFLFDLSDLTWRKKTLLPLGIKGATGTQASFLELFDGNHKKVEELEQIFVRKMGAKTAIPLSGQTYSRKQDVHLLDLLAGIAISSHKVATDLRLLAHRKEVEEGFGKRQVGSSAMPYKKNPMRSERICSLARFVLSLSENPRYTAGTQWLERTLDDSANRRITIPEAFLATDSILSLTKKVIEELQVNKKIIEKNIKEELPFLASEAILMECVKRGKDRQQIHDKLRTYSIEAAKRLREGGENNLIQCIGKDSDIPLSEMDLRELLDPKRFTGRAEEQVQSFLNGVSNEYS